MVRALCSLNLAVLAAVSLVACSLLPTTLETTHPAPITTATAAEPQPLCSPRSRHTINHADINRPVSQCRIYFYIRFIQSEGEKKWLQVVIQHAQPIPVEDGFPSPDKQLVPYWYRWVVRGSNGDLQRAWLAYFIQGRDGLYHTIVTQPEDEWSASYLEIYFEDINEDGADEDVTYEIPLAQFLQSEAP